MRVRKFLCIVFACFMLVNCLGISAGAANVEIQRDMKLVIERASGRFSLDVPANKTVGATTSFPLEAGEKVSLGGMLLVVSILIQFPCVRKILHQFCDELFLLSCWWTVILDQLDPLTGGDVSHVAAR